MLLDRSTLALTVFAYPSDEHWVLTYFTYLHTANHCHGFVQTAKALIEDYNKTPSFHCYSSLEGNESSKLLKEKLVLKKIN